MVDASVKNFADPDWSDNPVFDAIKQSYLLTSNWLNSLVSQAASDEAVGRLYLVKGRNSNVAVPLIAGTLTQVLAVSATRFRNGTRSGSTG